MKKLVDEGRLTFKESQQLDKITYHDSCHLKRTLNVSQQPRELLTKAGLPSDLADHNCLIYTDSGEGDRWPIDDGAADVVLSTETMEHVFDSRAFLLEARRILRPEGRLIVTVPFSARFGRTRNVTSRFACKRRPPE